MLLVVADDFGRTSLTSDRILQSFMAGKVSCASAMMYMEDSERAASQAKRFGMDVGLHLNFTDSFSDETVSPNLVDEHNKIARYLKARRFNQAIYNPGLRSEFVDLYLAQWNEYCRLYGREPERIDGHHHMHLCMNMVLLNKYPKGIRIRRNFTFTSGEKNLANRIYRSLLDRWLISRFQCTDAFYSIEPVERSRLERIRDLAKVTDVELMVHPGRQSEFDYLMSDDWDRVWRALCHRVRGE